MDRNPAPDHQDTVAVLAGYRDRLPEAAGGLIDPVELAWLVHEPEQRYGAALRLSNDPLEQMSTVSSTVEVLRTALVERR